MHINKLNSILTIKYGLGNDSDYTLSQEVVSKIGTINQTTTHKTFSVLQITMMKKLKK